MKEFLYTYFQAQGNALSIEVIFLNFLIALLIGGFIYISYYLSHSGTVYSARFNVSLVMLTLITTLIMTIIGNNIALSLGMVGALSIVRFRTAIKDPRDTAYIFWCIAAGICCGVSSYLLVLLGSAFIFLFLLVFGYVKPNDRYVLVIRGDKDSANQIENTVQVTYKGKAELRVLNTDASKIEYIYELSEKLMKKSNTKTGIVDELYKITGVKNVNLVCQNDEINR